MKHCLLGSCRKQSRDAALTSRGVLPIYTIGGSGSGVGTTGSAGEVRLGFAKVFPFGSVVAFLGAAAFRAFRLAPERVLGVMLAKLAFKVAERGNAGAAKLAFKPRSSNITCTKLAFANLVPRNHLYLTYTTRWRQVGEAQN